MYHTYSKGIIEIITGPMFSGKTEELIKRIKILAYAKIKTLVVKPTIDKRWKKDEIFSRSGSSIKTVACRNAKEIFENFQKDSYSAIAIDEMQFFDFEIIQIVILLANKGIRVIISGLDQDFEGKPFGVMPQLLSIADLVDKQQAVCNVCKNVATMTYRLILETEQVSIGDKEYEPRCRQCHLDGTQKKLS